MAYPDKKTQAIWDADSLITAEEIKQDPERYKMAQEALDDRAMEYKKRMDAAKKAASVSGNKKAQEDVAAVVSGTPGRPAHIKLSRAVRK